MGILTVNVLKLALPEANEVSWEHQIFHFQRLTCPTVSTHPEANFNTNLYS